jgi:hypothetical protein
LWNIRQTRQESIMRKWVSGMDCCLHIFWDFAFSCRHNWYWLPH